MTELEMLEQAIQGEAVEAAPGAVQVLPGLCLLPAVVVVQELINYSCWFFLLSFLLLHLHTKIRSFSNKYK